MSCRIKKQHKGLLYTVIHPCKNLNACEVWAEFALLYQTHNFLTCMNTKKE